MWCGHGLSFSSAAIATAGAHHTSVFQLDTHTHRHTHAYSAFTSHFSPFQMVLSNGCIEHKERSTVCHGVQMYSEYCTACISALCACMCIVCVLQCLAQWKLYVCNSVQHRGWWQRPVGHSKGVVNVCHRTSIECRHWQFVGMRGENASVLMWKRALSWKCYWKTVSHFIKILKSHIVQTCKPTICWFLQSLWTTHWSYNVTCSVSNPTLGLSFLYHFILVANIKALRLLHFYWM